MAKNKAVTCSTCILFRCCHARIEAHKIVSTHSTQWPDLIIARIITDGIYDALGGACRWHRLNIDEPYGSYRGN